MGSEMCIRDSITLDEMQSLLLPEAVVPTHGVCEVDTTPEVIMDSCFEHFLSQETQFLVDDSPPTSQTQSKRWAKDEWRQAPGCWIRVHNRPRKALFLPTGTKGGPDISTLDGRRTTHATFTNGHSEKMFGDKWTNRTWFRKKKF